MSKDCINCKRPVNEYYKLGNGNILCYDCYIREKNNISMRFNQEHNEKIRIRNDISILEVEIRNLKLNPEYSNYMQDDYAKTRPPICNVIDSLIGRRIELENQASFSSNSSLGYYAEMLNKAVYCNENKK
jgi:hypothetical protein